MTSTQPSGLVTTTFHKHASKLRVRISWPPEGYDLNVLDALRVALERAIAHLRSHKNAQASVTPLADLQAAFTAKQALMSAPS